MAKKDPSLKSYLQTSEELSEEENLEIEQMVSEEKGSRFQKLHFWSEWPKGKKIALLVGSILSALLLIFLITFFIVRPNNSKKYIRSSWHSVVESSRPIDRTLKAEVNLEGIRSLSDSLYDFNKKLNTVSYEASTKGSILYGPKLKEYSSLTSEMSKYYIDSATTLNKTDSDIAQISESELSDLKSKGEELKSKVDEFRSKNNLTEQVDANLFAVDVYISNVKLKKEEIEKEQKEEEAKKKQEEEQAIQKEANDKKAVESVVDSYFTAFVNGNEEGVKATLTTGYTSEYDFANLKPERRTNYYPRSYRIVASEKDGEKYKVTGSVTYVYQYVDSEGNTQENIQPVTEIYRIVYVKETESWKIDGRAES